MGEREIMDQFIGNFKNKTFFVKIRVSGRDRRRENSSQGEIETLT